MRIVARDGLLVLLSFLVGFFLATTLFFAHYGSQHAPTTPSQALASPAETIERSVPIVAVDEQGRGQVGTLTVKLIPGNNNVLVDTNPFLDIDIQYSANIAVAVAKLTTGRYAADKDFVLSYASAGSVVGGESASAVTAVAVIAALEGKDFKAGYAMTGAIRPDGTIGPVGGIPEKAQALAEAGYTHFLIPKGQGTFTYYEPVREPVRDSFGFVFAHTRYVPRTIDLVQVAREEWGIELIEVSTVTEAADLMLE
ncbi:hypothetical protein D6789_01040 [Candidatus Woesearchaeota archaeon]|nr:MAG: hypothetical protein D6789_01040 [Candidatus Woesearchaeota archaeon]